ncbi:PREDICTED: uncharacterized protein LOC109230337 [Nicotiana attenuata]|uniref:uncharacterized protein LOC109230337 n=1 Tax=Nicotiana attenuata TaxID=49451 RepID=UPI0009055122|nr:PREDICTED: uncharacterized protein LOC109230337 [Nicotiana attenuata]
MAKTSKIIPQKEKASSSRPADDKMPVEPRIEECGPGVCDLTSDFKIEKPSSFPGRCEPIYRYICSITEGDLKQVKKDCHWEGLRDNAVISLPPPGEEEAPKPAKNKKRKRVSPSDTPKPKKNKVHKLKQDAVALSENIVQQLRDEEEENEDAACKLVDRKRSAEVPKAAEPVMNAKVQPRTERISEDAPSKVPESSGAEDASRCDGQPVDVPEGASSEALQNGDNAPSDSHGAIDISDSPLPTFSKGQIQEAQAIRTPMWEQTPKGKTFSVATLRGSRRLPIWVMYRALMLHREAFSKSRAELNRCEADLKRLTEERDALKLLNGKKEEEIQDLRAELAIAHKGQTDLIEQVQQRVKNIEQLREEAKMKVAETLGWKQNMDRLASEKDTARAQLFFAKRQIQSMKEESLARAKKIEELEVRLAAELAKATSEAEGVKADAEAVKSVYQADAEAAHARAKEISDVAQIHARGFDLTADIESAKVLEGEAKDLLSDDDGSGSSSGSESGGDEDEAPGGRLGT